MEYILTTAIIYSIVITIIYLSPSNKVKKDSKTTGYTFPPPPPIKKSNHELINMISKITNEKDVKIICKGYRFEMDGYITSDGEYIVFHKDIERTQFICAIRKEEIKIITLA